MVNCLVPTLQVYILTDLNSLLNPLTSRVKPWVIQGLITFDFVDRTLKCDHSLKAVEQYFTMVLFIFQFYPVCNFGQVINFGLGTVRNERVKMRTQRLKKITLR